MNKMIHYIGLDAHKESSAVAIAPGNITEVRHYGIIGGTLDAVNKLVKKLSQEDSALRCSMERHSRFPRWRAKQMLAKVRTRHEENPMEEKLRYRFPR